MMKWARETSFKKNDHLIDLSKTELLKNSILSDIVLFEKHSIRRVYPAGNIIFSKGEKSDGIYIVLAGNVEIISYSLSGKEIIHNMVGKGGSFGEIGFFDRGPRTASVKAKDEVVSLFMPIEKFDKFSDQLSKQYWTSTVTLLCSILRKNSSYIEDVHFYSTKERIAFQLYRLCDDETLSSHEGGSISIRLSQEKLAQMLGLTREITNKVLSQLEFDGLVKLKRGRILIVQQKKLCQVVGKSE